MKIREKISVVCEMANEKFASQFGFNIRDASIDKILDYMHKPKDSSSLAVTRILFGIAMLFDIPDERGGASMEKRWGDPDTCHFPLVPFVIAIPMPYMAVVYAVLWCGAVGIMLGYKYRISASMFCVCYWYLFLIEKSYWNNHSYLFGLIALLLTCTEANCYWSIDAYMDPSKFKITVPYWNYFVLKYQFFILYFMAGMKKGTAEWLTGYSVKNLSEHWVFDPFKLLLTVSQTDYIVVHWFVFVFDLTIAIWMMYSRTRHVAMIFCAMFHLMNSRLFSIGMFPWVCLSTMPLFYPFDWPKILLRKLELYLTIPEESIGISLNKCLMEKVDCKFTSPVSKLECPDNDNLTPSDESNEQLEESSDNDDVFDDPEEFEESREVTSRDIKDHKMNNMECSYNSKIRTLCLIIFYVAIQAFLPYSHFITKGYNNWTNGLYGYSWDMMVHTWDTHAVIVKIVDNNDNTEYFIDPYVFTPNNRWTRHGDMIYQYARCVEENLIKESYHPSQSQNFSIYFDVWCSLNGRFIQRLFDSKVDILKVDWSPFESVSYLMPLLDEALIWREKLDGIRQQVHSWSNYTDVVFLADFPGYAQEKFISYDIINVTMTVLKGEVVYEQQVDKLKNEHSYKLTDGDHIFVNSGTFHKVINVGETPAYYMYTFYNGSQQNPNNDLPTPPKLPIGTEVYKRLKNWMVFFILLMKNMFEIVSSISSVSL